jgi:hypothetical protein
VYLLLIAMVALAGCQQETPVASVPTPGTTVGYSTHRTITNNGGGDVISFAVSAKRFAEKGKMMRFAGRCDSACTLYLALPRHKKCIMPGASFGFHRAHGGGVEANQRATSYLIRQYPGWVREWIQSRNGLSDEIKVMSYEYASRFIQPCRDAGRYETAGLDIGQIKR